MWRLDNRTTQCSKRPLRPAIFCCCTYSLLPWKASECPRNSGIHLHTVCLRPPSSIPVWAHSSFPPQTAFLTGLRSCFPQSPVDQPCTSRLNFGSDINLFLPEGWKYSPFSSTGLQPWHHPCGLALAAPTVGR